MDFAGLVVYITNTTAQSFTEGVQGHVAVPLSPILRFSLSQWLRGAGDHE